MEGRAASSEGDLLRGLGDLLAGKKEELAAGMTREMGKGAVGNAGRRTGRDRHGLLRRR